MRDITNRLRTQLDRLTKRQPNLVARVSLWDAICGLTDPADVDLPPEMVEAIEYAISLPDPVPDRIEAAIASAVDAVPYGLRELSPDITITEPGDQQ